MDDVDQARSVVHDHAMKTTRILAIPKDFPITWTKDGALRLGCDAPTITIHRPEPGLYRFLSALRHGMPAHTLRVEGERFGLSEHRVRDLMSQLAEVLIDISGKNIHTRDQRIVLTGAHEALGFLRNLLISAGNYVSLQCDSPADLIVYVEHYLSDPRLPARWLATGIPVLLVRFSDKSVQIGPVLSEEGPCYQCVNDTRQGDDTDWAFCASQLIDRTPPTIDSPVLTLAGAHVVDLVDRWKREAFVSDSKVTRIETHTGSSPTIHFETLEPAAGCACSDLDAVPAAA